MPRRRMGPMPFRGAGPMNPMEMCKMMWGSKAQGEGPEQPDLATEELRGLFFEWLAQVLDELKGLEPDPADVTIENIEKHLGVSKASAEWLKARLAEQQG